MKLLLILAIWQTVAADDVVADFEPVFSEPAFANFSDKYGNTSLMLQTFINQTDEGEYKPYILGRINITDGSYTYPLWRANYHYRICLDWAYNNSRNYTEREMIRWNYDSRYDNNFSEMIQEPTQTYRESKKDNVRQFCAQSETSSYMSEINQTTWEYELNDFGLEIENGTMFVEFTRPFENTQGQSFVANDTLVVWVTWYTYSSKTGSSTSTNYLVGQRNEDDALYVQLPIPPFDWNAVLFTPVTYSAAVGLKQGLTVLFILLAIL